MILIVEASDRRKHEAVLGEVFRQRYQHFVVRRNWSLPCRNGLDIDQYDSDDAVYFVRLDQDGSIVGSVRVNRTMPSSLLGDLFPFLIETGEAPRGASIFEGSRFIISPRERSAVTSRRIKADLLIGVVEYCLEKGGTHFQAVIDFAMLATFVAMSPKTRILGLPREYGGGVREHGGGRCVAYRWDLGPDLLADLQAFGGLPSVMPVAAAAQTFAMN